MHDLTLQYTSACIFVKGMGIGKGYRFLAIKKTYVTIQPSVQTAPNDKVPIADKFDL